MKTTFSIWVALAALSLYGQQIPEAKITLTPRDVKPKSVHLLGGPTDACQNVIFEYVGKTSDEIRDLRVSRRRVQIVKDGAVVVPDVGCSGYKDKTRTNYIGLVLIFVKYDEAKLAERILRGEK